MRREARPPNGSGGILARATAHCKHRRAASIILHDEDSAEFRKFSSNGCAQFTFMVAYADERDGKLGRLCRLDGLFSFSREFWNPAKTGVLLRDRRI